MPAIVHINDNNILVDKDDQLLRSQGFAWLKNGDVYFDLNSDNNAVHHCRLEPQQINSNYWQQCAQTAISSNKSGMRHAADLVWRHLGDLQRRKDLTDLILVVPSHYQANNLRLLLGICQSLGLTVNGVINKAVLALHQHIARPGHYLHVDVQLHQTVCSEVIVKSDSADAGSGVLRLGEVEILHEVGLQPMQDAILRAIQERFILSDRFDPLHHAETEQQLFDRLPSISELIKTDGKANIRVDYQGQRHGTSIDSKQWAAALQPYINQLKDFELTNRVSKRFYDFNGFQVTAFSDAGAINIEQKRQRLKHQTALLTHNGVDSFTDEAGKIIYRTELETNSIEILSTDDAPDSRATGDSIESPDRAAESSIVEQVKSPANNDKASATHLLQSGIAVPLNLAHIDLNGNGLKLSEASASNLAELLKADKIFIVSDKHRKVIRVDDRLGSDLVDGVIIAIRVLNTAEQSLSNSGGA